MTKETRHVIEKKRFPWALDDIILPLLEGWALYYFAQRGYETLILWNTRADQLQGALLLLAALTGTFFLFRGLWHMNSFTVIETPLGTEDNFLFCIDRVNTLGVSKREIDKWNYCVGVRAHGDLNPLPFWLTLICYENKIFINERPAFYLLSLWWTRSGVNKIIAEAKSLGQGSKEYAEREVGEIRARMAEHEQARAEGKVVVNDPWEQNHVDDPNSPAFYSRQAVQTFAMFFTAFAGAALLAVNVQNRSDKVKVLFLGAGVSIAVVFVLSLLPKSAVLIIWINAIGAGFVSKFLWNRFVSKDVKYRTRKAWVPFVIVLIFYLPLLWIFMIQ